MNFNETVNNLVESSKFERTKIKELSIQFITFLEKKNFENISELFTDELKFSLLNGTKEQAIAKLEFLKKASEAGKRVIISNEKKKELEHKSQFGISMNEVTNEMVAKELTKYFIDENFISGRGTVRDFIPYSIENVGDKTKFVQKTSNSTVYLKNQQNKKCIYKLYWILIADNWKISGISKNRFLFFNYWTIGTDYMPTSE